MRTIHYVPIMDITNLTSAFIGSFLGVLSGFLGAVYLDWNRIRRERRTHILALMREILSNIVRLRLLLKEGRREGALEDRAWRDLRLWADEMMAEHELLRAEAGDREQGLLRALRRRERRHAERQENTNAKV